MSGAATLAAYRLAVHLEMSMSVKKVGPDNHSRFNYILCIDIVVAVCIVIVAGRPDGLAITISAAVVAVLAIVYRCTMGVMSYMDKKASKAQARALALGRQRERDAAAVAKRNAPVEPPFSTRSRTQARRKSWLSDDD